MFSPIGPSLITAIPLVWETAPFCRIRRPPQINASLSGTAGENGWFVSPAELTVAYSDPAPGSGLSATSALINGTPTDVSQPVTLPDGVYNVVLDVRDVAGLTAQVSQTAYVDTTAPSLSPQQPQAEVNGYMNGSVIFQGAVSDATSGVRTVQVTVDGTNWDTATLYSDGTWVLDWHSAGIGDGAYTPRVAAVDNAGNRTETSLSAINLDNTPPGDEYDECLVHLGKRASQGGRQPCRYPAH